MNFKVENQVALSREELADWLADLADALREDGSPQLPLAGPSLTLAVSDEVHVEVEASIDGDDVELELELAWSTRKGRSPGSRKARESGEEAGHSEDDAASADRGDGTGTAESDSMNAPTKGGAEDEAPQKTSRTSSASSSGASSGSTASRTASTRSNAAPRAGAKTSTMNGAEASRPRA